jgi:antitoxin CptB
MNITYKKLIFKTRRGMLELDLLLRKYIENNFSHMTDEQISQFESLMDLHDPDLLDLLINENSNHPDFLKHKSVINNIIMCK